MIEFKKYSDIDNAREGYTTAILAQTDPVSYWVAHEKIHGTNFSIWITENEIKYAKRSGFITEGDNFYGYKNVMQILAPSFATIQDFIKSKATSKIPIDTITIFGELFGDGIQKGVQYPLGKHFFAFDTMIDGKYCSHEFHTWLCTASDIPLVPFIQAGSLLTLLELQPEYLTALNPIADNYAEGIVIKPVVPLYLLNGSRVIIKLKNAKFSERKSKSAIPRVLTLSDVAHQLVEELATYITDNRMYNVISHIGEVTAKDFGKVQGLLIQDCVKEYINEGNPDPVTQHKEEWKIMHKLLCQLSNTMLRPIFINMITGNITGN